MQKQLDRMNFEGRTQKGIEWVIEMQIKSQVQRVTEMRRRALTVTA